MKTIKLYYDEECPFCKEYSKYIQLRKKYDIEIINAREAIEKMKYFIDKGFNINDGMIVEIGLNIYLGADAARILDDYISKDTFIDKFISLFVKIPGFKNIIYPLVKLIRTIVLKLLRKDPSIEFKD